jgi:GT2 family glycosyltransferase
MQVSIVIVNYNVRHFLHQCLLSVQTALQGMTGEIIVVDNASSDDSHDMMQQYFPEVKWIGNSENVGFSKANNQGVALASGKYILILNPDTIISEDTLRKLYAFAEKNPQQGGIGVPMYDGTGAFLPESKRKYSHDMGFFIKDVGQE